MDSSEGSRRWEEKLEGFERVIDERFRRDLFAELPSTLNEEIDSANARVKVIEGVNEKSRQAYDAEVAKFDALAREIEELSGELEARKPDPTDAASVEAFNERVRECNEKIGRQKELYAAVNEARRKCERQIEDRNEEVDGVRKKLGGRRRAVEERLDVLKRWHAAKGPEKFYRELNEAFVELKALCRDGGGQTHRDLLDRLRVMRREMGRLARKEADERDDGMIIVEAFVHGEERCTMMVDSGSSITTLSPQMVEALGLQDEVGGEIELSLPAGLTVKARQLLIPDLEVQDQETPYVKGVVLEESSWGTDGCLGQSFLNRFHYSIENTSPRSLTLKPITEPDSEPENPSGARKDRYDVFITHKSEDIEAARAVYDLLSEARYKVFFSPVTLPQGGVSEFSKEIDHALEVARHMVVVGSSREYLEKSWVRYEWALFDSMIRSGRKTRSNIVNVLAGDFDLRNLPVALSRFTAVRLEDTNWKTKLVGFLPR